MKALYIIVITFLTPLYLFGQKGYFVSDSTLALGVTIIDKGPVINSHVCTVKNGESIIEYSPYDINEYGFSDKRVYFSKEIIQSDSIVKVFLERIYNKEFTLYYYQIGAQKFYYLEKDSSDLIALPKLANQGQDYKEALANFTHDFNYISDLSDIVRYNKFSIVKYLNIYGKREERYFPRFKYGVILGGDFEKLILMQYTNSDIREFKFKLENSLMTGLFMEQPVLASDFSIRLELLYSSHGYSYNYLNDSKDMDLIVNLKTFKVPVLLKYELPLIKIRPFINGGVVGSYNIKNESIIHTTTISNNLYTIQSKDKSTLVNRHQLYFCAGAGVEYQINKKNIVSVEFRKLYPYKHNISNLIGVEGFNIISSITF